MNQSLLIHIGYQKTGTTWLQKQYFNKNKSGFFFPFDRKELVRNLVMPHPLDFDPAVGRAYINDTLALHSESTHFPAISHERLSGVPHVGGYDSQEIAYRLAQVAPSARILIVIREQKDMILSTYAQYVKAGGGRTIQTYLYHPFHPMAVRQFELARFRYDRLISYYMELFGRDRVLALPYELFVQTPNLFLKRINNFCEIPEPDKSFKFEKQVNVSPTVLAIRLLAKLNRISGQYSPVNPSPLFTIHKKRHRNRLHLVSRLVRSLAPPTLENRVREHILQTISQEVGDYYHKSNTIASEQIGIDLSQFRYQMG